MRSAGTSPKVLSSRTAARAAALGRQRPKATRVRLLALWALALWALPPAALAVDRVTLRRDNQELKIVGQRLVTASDGGLLLKTRDGQLWAIEPDELVEHTSDSAPFEPLSGEELGAQILRTLPDGFALHETAHYLIAYDTSRAYAQWCGSLFERLNLAFTNYWEKKKFDVAAPEFPLVAVIFADRQAYIRYATPEVGPNIEQIIGYYSLRTNRVTTFDLTGVEIYRQPGDRRGSAAGINQMLGRPAAERAVATIMHEATHQLAFNGGLQTRYTDVPLWVSEGIAVYFETPDLKSQKGWRNIGAVNYRRLDTFRRYLLERPGDSLHSLLASDERFRDPRQADAAYAESWALNYFLLQKKTKLYHEYLRRLGKKPLLVWDGTATRLEEFREVFGELQALDAEFLKAIEKVR